MWNNSVHSRKLGFQFCLELHHFGNSFAKTFVVFFFFFLSETCFTSEFRRIDESVLWWRTASAACPKPMEFENDGTPLLVIVKVGSPHQRRKWMRYEWRNWFWESYESQFEIADSTTRGSANGSSSTATNTRALFYDSGMFKVVQRRDKYVSVRTRGLCWKWVTLKWKKMSYV